MKMIVIPQQQKDFGGKNEIRHLPHPQVKGGFITPCGWCDIGYEERQGQVDCPACLSVVAFRRALSRRLTSVPADSPTSATSDANHWKAKT